MRSSELASFSSRLQGCSEMRKLDFDQTLLEAIDHALLAFGESPRKAIYYHLDKSFKLKREDIAEETDEFSNALNIIFGPGAEVIEKLIVKNLHSKLNLNFEEKAHFEFANYVGQAREMSKREKTCAENQKNKQIKEKYT